MHEKVGIGEGFWFMSMAVSAAAMDSENPVIPGSICLVSALALLWISRKEELMEFFGTHLLRREDDERI